jgi:hypothetical protein
MLWLYVFGGLAAVALAVVNLVLVVRRSRSRRRYQRDFAEPQFGRPVARA